LKFSRFFEKIKENEDWKHQIFTPEIVNHLKSLSDNYRAENLLKRFQKLEKEVETKMEVEEKKKDKKKLKEEEKNEEPTNKRRRKTVVPYGNFTKSGYC
jgi:hypothetical protein